MSTTKTAEAVCIGHPDKLCDLIADTILDDILYEDPAARVAVEVMATGRRIIVTGEITTTCRPRIRESVRYALVKAGYVPWKFLVFVWTRRQSPDINAGVTRSLEARFGDDTEFALQGAGDQGTVYGYATTETPERLPLPLVLSHEICARLDKARKDGTITGIKSDGKTQVTVRYDAAGKPVAVETVVVSIQHEKIKDLDELAAEVKTLIVAPACKPYLPISADTEILVNPSGSFTVGGPKADTGLTGRKLMVDTYGGLAPHGGGAFSGKDASKVDRSGAYMARLIAKTIVDSGLAHECQVSISYAIGKADPVAFTIDTLGTGEHSDQILNLAAREVFSLRPGGIIDVLNLRKPGFTQYSTYGHFGHAGLGWENSFTHVDALRKAVKKHARENDADS
ncbi:MAG: methionine adenosyltransferase [Actinotignum sanguinis]|uniref:methionine adenosyltransferase n=1 Tax=Actinomycetaceae TaxID=2049 RepID=UPI00254ED5E6|nr:MULTISPECIES: methionine adenosyltransferase [Actinomycetaceae]MDK8319986.1 methionine adenosyltransferase [Actinobaculum massiliense]MDK8609185.1 methionine adenosyltransferase [Actinomycetaceae bacterium UMB8041A]MDK8802469.1 methionine adenosyltransferase [Actinotignum sanguinis]